MVVFRSAKECVRGEGLECSMWTTASNATFFRGAKDDHGRDRNRGAIYNKAMFDPRTDSRRMAQRFLLTALVAGTAATGLGYVLITLFPAAPPRPRMPVMPPAFLVSTLLLVVTSVALARAEVMVRRERQREFRQSLLAALVAGTCFTSTQAWGLSSLRLSADLTDDGAGVNTFLFVFAVLHAVHVTVGLLFLSFVNVQARADRYDHEYYWGARFCGWFWHALGVVWLVILGAFTLAALFLHELPSSDAIQAIRNRGQDSTVFASVRKDWG
jgi:heme/copper-type cytochrome/quinol oxidase subunit 3